MVAVFNFQALLTVLLLLICTCAYLRARVTSWIDYCKIGSKGIPYKLARVGERLSPFVSLALIAVALHTLWVK